MITAKMLTDQRTKLYQKGRKPEQLKNDELVEVPRGECFWHSRATT